MVRIKRCSGPYQHPFNVMADRNLISTVADNHRLSVATCKLATSDDIDQHSRPNLGCTYVYDIYMYLYLYLRQLLHRHIIVFDPIVDWPPRWRSRRSCDRQGVPVRSLA